MLLLLLCIAPAASVLPLEAEKYSAHRLSRRMQSQSELEADTEKEDKRAKKVRRGTRGQAKCKPLYGKEKKVPTPKAKAETETEE